MTSALTPRASGFPATLIKTSKRMLASGSQSDELEPLASSDKEATMAMLPIEQHRLLDYNPADEHPDSLSASSSQDRLKFIDADDRQHSWPLWGFYSYSFASEVFAIVSSGLFLPITLEQFARDNGALFPAHDLPCPGSLKAAQLKTTTTPAALPGLNTTCEVRLLGRWFDTASFPLYVFSLSVAVQAFVVASMGDAADDATMRKFLLLCFAAAGSLAGMLFFALPSLSPAWPISALLTLVSNVALGASGVCLNSYIPGLAKTPPLRGARKSFGDEDDVQDDEQYKARVSVATASISSKGIAIGFASGISALGIALVLITFRGGDTDSLRWTIGASGVWWAVFTIPAALWLPPLKTLWPRQLVNPFHPKTSCLLILSTLCQYRRLGNTIRFLMAWFLLSDAFATITSTAILFGKTALGMPSSHLILIGIIAPTTGIAGALAAPMVQARLAYCKGPNGSLKMFKLLIALNCLVPSYVASGVVLGTSALSTEWEMYVLAAVFGLVYGAFQSYARSVYAELIPPGQEAKWYALYSITDKSSSFFGPFIVGVIADYTHNIRYGFLFILSILLISFPILNSIDLVVGKSNAECFVLEGRV